MEYITSVFNSRNTCIDGRATKRNHSSAGNYAAKLSELKDVYKVIIRSGEWFEEYKQGQKTKWSN